VSTPRKYVALLRGVNVGGNHRVPKADFQAVLEGLGFRDIVIYINSGNAVFTSDAEPTTAEVAAALKKFFGFEIPTLILPAEKVIAIAEAIPKEWTNDPPKPDKSGQKSDVIYLFDEVNTPDVLETLGYRPEFETMVYVDGAVLANVLRKYQTRYSLLKIVGKPLYRQITVRNIATAKKLAELAKL
jgi:uncharacterized protein (DUF1697 family)